MPARASIPNNNSPRMPKVQDPQFARPPRRSPFSLFHGRLLTKKDLPRVIGVVILAHLGNLVAIVANVEVAAVVVFLAVGRGGVRFRLHRASIAFADDGLEFPAESAAHHRLDYSGQIAEPLV